MTFNPFGPLESPRSPSVATAPFSDATSSFSNLNSLSGLASIPILVPTIVTPNNHPPTRSNAADEPADAAVRPSLNSDSTIARDSSSDSVYSSASTSTNGFHNTAEDSEPITQSSVGFEYEDVVNVFASVRLASDGITSLNSALAAEDQAVAEEEEEEEVVAPSTDALMKRSELGIVSIHMSSLGAGDDVDQKRHQGPWFSCAITPDDRLVRLDQPGDGQGKVHADVFDFWASLERDLLRFSSTAEDEEEAYLGELNFNKLGMEAINIARESAIRMNHRNNNSNEAEEPQEISHSHIWL